MADEALAKAEANGPQDELVSGALLRRAQIAIAAGQAELALADARRAVDAEVAARAARRRSSRLGRMFLTLAEAQLTAGRAGDARTTLEQAARHLEATLGPSHSDTIKARRIAGRRA